MASAQFIEKFTLHAPDTVEWLRSTEMGDALNTPVMHDIVQRSKAQAALADLYDRSRVKLDISVVGKKRTVVTAASYAAPLTLVPFGLVGRGQKPLGNAVVIGPRIDNKVCYVNQ